MIKLAAIRAWFRYNESTTYYDRAKAAIGHLNNLLRGGGHAEFEFQVSHVA